MAVVVFGCCSCCHLKIQDGGTKAGTARDMMEEERRNKDTKRIYFGGLFDCVSESEIR